MNRLLVIPLLLFTLPSLAIDYWVNFASGSDAANGTTTATPWKHCPGDAAATGNALSTTPAPGANIFFMGTVYNGTIVIKSSGTVALPISYIGTNCVITRSNITLGTPSNPEMGIHAISKSNIVFRGLDFKDIGGYADSDPILSGAANSITRATSYDFELDGNIAWGLRLQWCRDIQVIDCDFYEIGHARNIIQNDNGNVINGTALQWQAGTNLTVSGCTFKDVSICLRVTTALNYKGVTITNCLFTGPFRWGMSIENNNQNYRMEDVLVTKSVIRDYHHYESAFWQGRAGQNPHTDGIFIRGSYVGISTNIVIDSCIFSSDAPSAAMTDGGTAHIYVSQGPSATVRNCIISNTRHWSSILIGTTLSWTTNKPQRIKIYNNLFYNAQSSFELFEGDNAVPYTTADRQVWFQNNIIVNTNVATGERREGVRFRVAEIGPTSFIANGNNLYWYPTTGVGTAKVWYNQGTLQTFSQVQALGYEGNSVYGNPGWSNVVYGVNTSNLNFHLTGNSAAIGNGADLSAEFTKDFDGVIRQTPWDIGPFSYSVTEAPPPDTTPPTPNPSQIESVTQLSPTSFQVVAVESVDDTSSFVSYQFRLATLITVLSQTNRTYVWTGLTPGATYYATVRSADGFGNRTLYANTNTVVMSNLPPDITILAPTNVIATSVTVGP